MKAADGTEQSLTLTSKNVLDYLLMQALQRRHGLPAVRGRDAQGPLDPYVSDVAPKPSGGGFARIQHFAINCSDDPNASMKQFKLKQEAGLPAGLPL